VIWLDESSFTLFPVSGRAYVWRTHKEAYNSEYLVPTLKHEEGSVVVKVEIKWYPVGRIITLHGRITTREYVDRLGNQAHPMIQTLSLNNDVVFKTTVPPVTQLKLLSHGLTSM
jgi:hypothetical protein